MLLPPPRSTLFPYTTLFRSRGERHQLWAHRYHPVRTRLLDEGNVHDRETEREVPGLDEVRSEEHTSELQSRVDLVCRLLLEKKNKTLLGREIAVETNDPLLH